MTTLSKAQLRDMLENLVAKVSDGAHADDAWKAQWIKAGTPELPDEPMPEQIDAGNEIVKMITDEANIAGMRAEMALMWNDGIDASAYAEASNEIFAKAREAIVKGEQPTSPAGRAIAREWLGKVAEFMKRDPDSTFIEWARNHLPALRAIANCSRSFAAATEKDSLTANGSGSIKRSSLFWNPQVNADPIRDVQQLPRALTV